MLDNCHYDAVKILHELSKLAWFVEKHAKPDEHKERHAECVEFYHDLLEDLEKHIEVMKGIIG